MADDKTTVDAAPAEDAPAEPTHAPIPDGLLAEPPRTDGVNLTGCYLAQDTSADAVPGSTIVLTLQAGEGARRGYEEKGYTFLGYLPEA